jgi:hypothetical protein
LIEEAEQVELIDLKKKEEEEEELVTCMMNLTKINTSMKQSNLKKVKKLKPKNQKNLKESPLTSTIEIKVLISKIPLVPKENQSRKEKSMLNGLKKKNSQF